MSKEVLGVTLDKGAAKEVLGVMTTPPKGVGIAKSVQLTLDENEDIEKYCRDNGISFSVFARLAFKMMLDIDFVESVKETVKAKHYRVENGEIVRDINVDTEI